jgi:hypothetical protein
VIDRIDNSQFKYNKGFGYLTFFGLLALFIFILIKTFQYTDASSTKIMTCFDGLLLMFLVIVAIKYFIPAITGKIALEINDNFILDNTRHQQINWADVKDLHLVDFRNSSGVEFILKNDQPSKMIRLQYIAGTDKEIFDALNNHFKWVKN